MYSSEKTDSQKVSPAPAAGISVNSANTKAPIPWSSGLFDCFVDLRSCLITYWCPCITFGQISEVVDQGPHSCVTNGGIYALILLFTRCQCFFSSLYRTKMRQQYNLEEGPMGISLFIVCVTHVPFAKSTEAGEPWT
ncbi:protein PLANT CADMIUM RESISTANCE 2-like [Macadamia integrifolia]|uniref:protein PLANT CADMIUM RESISTANCE 2-like n=1 Tax=Macadamia integrifolia TaxID=60698 RepID=UPI001C4E95CC|nr:protein PLANT CADMIUM RESISTANCE 2-like [Macadamia integrifolia]